MTERQIKWWLGVMGVSGCGIVIIRAFQLAGITPATLGFGG
jgi:hypothetical protein